jgi:predicted enzyme related to lactoylglutathione lyase
MTHHLATMLIVDDIERPAAFYQRFFDFELVFDGPMYKGIKQLDSGIEFGFMTPSDEGPCETTNGKGLMFGFRVDDVDAEHARLSKLGAEPHGEPTDKPWGDRSFTLADPCGATLYIFQEGVPQPEMAQYIVKPGKKTS